MNISAKREYNDMIFHHTIIDFVVHENEIKAVVVNSNGSISVKNIEFLTVDDTSLIPKPMTLKNDPFEDF